MRFGEARRRDVVATDSATKVGRVEGFLVDAATGRVAALRCGKTSGDGQVLPWEDVQSFGVDAVTVARADVLREPHGQREELGVKGKLEMLGRRVLSERGDGMGDVVDVDFDPRTGEVLAVLTGTEEVPGERLLGVGGYAVVVRAPER